MKVRYEKERLMLVAETEFEEEVLQELSSSSTYTAWLKHGASACDIVGLVLQPQKVGDSNE